MAGDEPFPIIAPVAVLSDLHLGHPASFISDPAMLMPLLEGMNTAVFNGDSCELVSLKRSPRAKELLQKLAQLCLERGIRPIFLTGNHDPQISSLHYLDLFEGRVFMTHGDILHPGIAPWSRDAGAMATERQRLLCGQPEPDDLDDLCLLSKQTSMVIALHDDKSRHGFAARLKMVGLFAAQPWRIAIAWHFWANVARFCRHIKSRFRPAASVMLIGHTHRAGCWPGQDFTVVNTGSFQPLSKPLLVRFDDESMSVFDTGRRANEYRLGRELYRQRLIGSNSTHDLK